MYDEILIKKLKIQKKNDNSGPNVSFPFDYKKARKYSLSFEIIILVSAKKRDHFFGKNRFKL